MIAKSATANIYQPILLGTNALYVVLLLGLDVSYTVWNILGMLATWGLQAYAYLGILDQAANAKASGGNKSKNLIGGAHLDLLGLTLFIQYGTILHSTKWYWVLGIVPIWGGWTLYQTFYGGGKNKPSNDGTTDSSSGANNDRRQKRAEKRRQKWS